MSEIVRTSILDINQLIAKDLALAVHLKNDEMILKIFKALPASDSALLLDRLTKQSRAYVASCLKKKHNQ